jgi:hypothetical protein
VTISAECGLSLCLLEGATLVLLLFVAVPLKHLGIYREAMSITGPLHGLAFRRYKPEQGKAESVHQ